MPLFAEKGMLLDDKVGLLKKTSLFILHFFCIFVPHSEKNTRHICRMDTQQMIQLIAEYFKTQPVLKAWLFGSYSRDEQRPDSDVDIMVALDQDAHVGLFKLSGMHLDLQDLLKMRVDLVTDKGLLPFARKSAEQDKKLIYERTA